MKLWSIPACPTWLHLKGKAWKKMLQPLRRVLQAGAGSKHSSQLRSLSFAAMKFMLVLATCEFEDRCHFSYLELPLSVPDSPLLQSVTCYPNPESAN